MLDRNIGGEVRIVMLWILSLAFLFCRGGAALADDEADAARRIMAKWGNTVVTVEMTIEQRMVMSGREMHKTESKTEAIATVIEPSGLAVLSLFSTDPSTIYNLFSGGGFGGEDMPSFNWESQVRDVKMILSDGTEVPASIVLRDQDLDLAFVRPVEKLGKTIPSVDLSGSVGPQVMDQVVTLACLGKVASRAQSVALSRIQAVVEKPRTFYVLSSLGMEGGLGAPVFTLDGDVVGVLLLRMMKSQRIGIAGMLGGMKGSGMLAIVLPAGEIAEVAKQVPEITDKKGEQETTVEGNH